MVREQDFLLTSRRARFRVACNHFKHLVLGDSHVPNCPQTQALLEKMSFHGFIFSDSTWKSWFAENAPLPQPTKIEFLDECLIAVKNAQSATAVSRYSHHLGKGYLRDLIHGGLMAHLLAPTSALEPADLLTRRAQEYQPRSPLHLHWDAIDVAGWCEDIYGLSWSVVATIAADRVLQLLWERWSPRAGSLYPSLKSDLSLRWENSNEVERKEIKKGYDELHAGIFNRLMSEIAQPDWQRTGVSPDIPCEHIYKLLFALAAHPEFLVQDRLQAWALDLATSALAMHAVAWTDRYKTMALGSPPEQQYWWAFQSILFDPEPFEEMDDAGIALVIGSWKADWSEASLQVLSNARDTYWAELDDLGLEPPDICAGLMRTRERHPLIFYPNRDVTANSATR